jgi:hypothetical protein
MPFLILETHILYVMPFLILETHVLYVMPFLILAAASLTDRTDLDDIWNVRRLYRPQI